MDIYIKCHKKWKLASNNISINNNVTLILKRSCDRWKFSLQNSFSSKEVEDLSLPCSTDDLAGLDLLIEVR